MIDNKDKLLEDGKFARRTFQSVGELLQEVKFLIDNRRKIKSLQKGRLISPAFRERLMIAVTAVNDCRYCSYYHTRLALKSGISYGELQSLLAGTIEDSPEDEITGLLYAQHWAEHKGDPDEKFREMLFDRYGSKRAGQIELTLRLIRFGNLFGNSIDYLLFRLSLGKLGLKKEG